MNKSASYLELYLLIKYFCSEITINFSAQLYRLQLLNCTAPRSLEAEVNSQEILNLLAQLSIDSSEFEYESAIHPIFAAVALLPRRKSFKRVGPHPLRAPRVSRRERDQYR